MDAQWQALKVQITKILADFSGVNVGWRVAEIEVKIERRTREKLTAAYKICRSTVQVTPERRHFGAALLRPEHTRQNTYREAALLHSSSLISSAQGLLTTAELALLHRIERATPQQKTLRKEQARKERIRVPTANAVDLRTAQAVWQVMTRQL